MVKVLPTVHHGPAKPLAWAVFKPPPKPALSQRWHPIVVTTRFISD